MFGRIHPNWQALLACLIVILTITKTSLANEITFAKLTTRHGLSQNDVLCIYQDSRGFMWFGTNDGLNRYDGYTFVKYESAAPAPYRISGNIVNKIVEDTKQNLWIHVLHKGLNVLNLKTGQIDELPPFPRPSQREVESLFCDANDNIWLANETGLTKITRHSTTTAQANNPTWPSNQYTYQHFDAQNWFGEENLQHPKFIEGSDGKLHLICANTFFFNIDSRAKPQKVRIPHIGIANVVQSEAGLIAASFTGLVLLKPDYQHPQNTKTIALQPAHKMISTCLMIDKKGLLWRASGNGLFVYQIDKHHNRVKRIRHITDGNNDYQLSSPHVRSLFQDQSGILWVGTNGGGINKYNPNKKHLIHIEPKPDVAGSIVGGRINGIATDSLGNIWVVNQQDVIQRLPAQFTHSAYHASNHWETLYRGNTYATYCLAQIKHGNAHYMWSGKQTMLRVANTALHKTPYSTWFGAHTVHQSDDGLIWYGKYGKGLFCYNANTGQTTNYTHMPEDSSSILSNIVRCIISTHNNQLLIGTHKGISLLQTKQTKQNRATFVNIPYQSHNAQGLSNPYVLCLFQSSTKEIWVGTLGGGLNKLIGWKNGKQARFKHYTTQNGLPNNVVKAIVEDDAHNLWIASNKGLTRFNPETEVFRTFDIQDGLQDYEFSDLAACKLADGRLAFGGVNGINIFNPADIENDTTQARPVFTALFIGNQRIQPNDSLDGKPILLADINATQKLVLSHKQANISLEFASLHFASPEKNRYAYRLSGLDKHWNHSLGNKRRVNYKLKPGEYEFMLRCANSDGITNPRVKRLKIIVQKPFWRTAPMLLVYGAVLLVLSFLIDKYARAQIQLKNQLKAEALEKEKVKELTQLKLKFFTNISHEFRTPLSLIAAPLDNLLRYKYPPELADAAQNLAHIKRNVDTLLRLINQLIDFRRLEQGQLSLQLKEQDLSHFLHTVHAAFAVVAQQKKVVYALNLPQEPVYVFFDEDKLEKVLFNLLSNAFKYTPPNGKVEIKLKPKPNHLCIEVTDTGEGIPPNKQNEIFNRFYHGEKSQGSGIGLDFVKSLMELMQGDINFSSTINQGTSFLVKLPYYKQASATQSASPTATPAATTATQKQKPTPQATAQRTTPQQTPQQMSNAPHKCLLVVEDNTELNAFICAHFASSYRVVRAFDGHSGYQTALAQHPDIIISDIEMPKLDGWALTQKIKHTIEICHIPLILLTAKTSPDAQKKAYRSGADAFVTKPFNLDVLQEQVAALLNSRALLRTKYLAKIDAGPQEYAPTARDKEFLKQLDNLVGEHLGNENFSVSQLAEQMRLSRPTLNKKLKELTSVSGSTYIRRKRMLKAGQRLRSGQYTVSEVTYSVGYVDLNAFRGAFKKEYGLAPSAYLKKYRDTNNENSPKTP